MRRVRYADLIEREIDPEEDAAFGILLYDLAAVGRYRRVLLRFEEQSLCAIDESLNREIGLPTLERMLHSVENLSLSGVKGQLCKHLRVCGRTRWAPFEFIVGVPRVRVFGYAFKLDSDTIRIEFQYDLPRWRWRMQALVKRVESVFMARYLSLVVLAYVYSCFKWVAVRKCLAVVVSAALGALGVQLHVILDGNSVLLCAPTLQVSVDATCCLIDAFCIGAVFSWNRRAAYPKNLAYALILACIVFCANVCRLVFAIYACSLGYSWSLVHDLPYVLLYSTVVVGALIHFEFHGNRSL